MNNAKCPNCQVAFDVANHKWGGHGESLYKCPSCELVLTVKRNNGSCLAALVAIPLLAIGIKYALIGILHPVIENTRFEEPNRFLGISIVAAIAIVLFAFVKLVPVTLVVRDDDRRTD